jgi:hypothetical protein
MIAAELIEKLQAGPVDARTATFISELMDLPQDAQVVSRSEPEVGMVEYELTISRDWPQDIPW